MTTNSPRKDVVRNRSRIIEGARQAYAQHGAGVPLSAIARIAGLGTATLYRHFPSREELLAAMYGEQIRRRIAVLDEAVLDEDPWRGFVRSLEEVVLLEIETPGITQAIADHRSSIAVYEHFRARALADLGILAQRLRDEEIVRPDVGQEDMLLILVALGAVTVSAREGASRHHARRLIELLTSGLRLR